MKQLKFTNWVREFGIDRLANECGVGPHQVRAWLRGEASPRSERLVRIIQLSKNKFTLVELIQETTRAQK